MEMVLFTNWLDESFTGEWAGAEEVFTAGESRYLEDWKAKHYAKHLVDQHFNGKDMPTNHFSRKELEKKCFEEVVKAKIEENIESEIYNKNKELEKSPNKVEAKEKEFADLEDKTKKEV